MKEVFKAEQIAENVYWVGAVDWNVRSAVPLTTLFW